MNELRYIPADVFQGLLSEALPPVPRAEAFATLCRINTLYMVARAGSGHLGSSFSAMDIVAWLHLQELGRERGDLFFSSKGHDCPGFYAVRLALRLLDFDLLHRLRRLGGLPGHPDVHVPGVVANTGSLGMGVAKAKGLLLADRLRGRDRRVFVLLGDGELQEGQTWESLLPCANLRLAGLTAIVDHNKLQSDTWVDQVSSLGDLEARFAAHGWMVTRCDGHDLTALAACLDRCRRERDRPQVIVADTVKGKGVSFMERTAHDAEHDLERYYYHSGAPKPEEYARALDELSRRANGQLAALGLPPLRTEAVAHTPAAPAQGERLVAAYAQALLEAGRGDPDLVVLDADLALDCGVLPFRKAFPERYFQCGIAEQDMVSTAGAMARQGLMPVVHSFACFLSARPNEQIFNNATERSHVLYVGSLAGVLPGGPGHSHQCVRDIAALKGIPDMVMLEPGCAREVGPALDYLLRVHDGPGYLRLVTIPVARRFDLPEDYALTPGRGVELRAGRDAVLVAAGPVLLNEAMGAAEILAGEGVELGVVDLPWLNRVDADWLAELAGRCPLLVLAENHFLEGGQGETVAAALAGLRLPDPPRLVRVGLGDIPRCGLNTEVLATHGLDAAGLAARVREHLQA
ncbi:MAG: transketolase C-terminal domain-containing protein [Thermodesulfobacteriota bacterium]